MCNHENNVERQRRRIQELVEPTPAAKARRHALLTWFRTRRPLDRDCCTPWGVDSSVLDDLAPVDLIDWYDDGEVLPIVAGEFYVRLHDNVAELRRSLAAQGWRQDPPEEGSNVVRFRAIDRHRADVKAALRAAKALDLKVAPNHFIPLNYDAKGQVGPMATCCELVDHTATETSGIRLMVIDTGLATEPDRDRTDGWLQLAQPSDLTDIDQLDQVGKDGDPGPDGYLDVAAGHGTSVAGIAECVVDGIEAVAIRALGPDGFGEERQIAAAVRRAAAELGEAGGVINMSFGSQSYDDEEMVVLADAIEQVRKNERICLVASAGNWGDDQKSWPAAFEGVVAVAGLTEAGKPADWSSRGEWVDFSAQGEGIVAPYVVGRERPGMDPGEPHRGDADNFVGPNPNALWLGTSFAAPQVAALLARYMHKTGATAGEAKTALADANTPFEGCPDDRKDESDGYGVRLTGLLRDCGCEEHRGSVAQES